MKARTRVSRRYQASIPIEALVEKPEDGALVPEILCTHEISTNGCVICTRPGQPVGNIRSVRIHVAEDRSIDIPVDPQPDEEHEGNGDEQGDRDQRDIARLKWKNLDPKDAARLVRYLEKIPHGVPQDAKADFLENENEVMHSEIMNIESRRQRGFHLLFLLIAAYFAYLAAPYRVFSGKALSSEQMLLFGLVGVWVSVMLCFHCIRFQDFLSRANRRISHLYRSIGANRGWVFAHDHHYFARTVMPLGTQFDEWRARCIPHDKALAFAQKWSEWDEPAPPKNQTPGFLRRFSTASWRFARTISAAVWAPARRLRTWVLQTPRLSGLRRSSVAALVRLNRASTAQSEGTLNSYDKREKFAEWLPYNVSTIWVLLFIQSFFVFGAFAFTSILTRTVEDAAAPKSGSPAAIVSTNLGAVPAITGISPTRPNAPKDSIGLPSAPATTGAALPQITDEALDLFNWKSFTKTLAAFGFFFLGWIHFACAAFFKHHKLTWEARRISSERPNPRFPDHAFRRAFPNLDRSIRYLGTVPSAIAIVAFAAYLLALLNVGGTTTQDVAHLVNRMVTWQSLLVVATLYALLKGIFLRCQFLVGDHMDADNERLRLATAQEKVRRRGTKAKKNGQPPPVQTSSTTESGH